MIFPVVMYECENWTTKKAEHWRTDAFELSCWRRLLRVPWTARRSNESILKEISPEYSLEELMLKLKLQYFGHLMQRTDSLEKTLMDREASAVREVSKSRTWLSNWTDTKPSSTYHDFKTIERIVRHYRLLLHLDSGLWGTCPALI